MLNHLADEVKQHNENGTHLIAPTDSRFRPDMRLFEEGIKDEADKEKKRLEVK